MGVEFEENRFNPRSANWEATPKIAAWLIKKGVVKTVSAANIVQIISAVIFFALAIYFAF